MARRNFVLTQLPEQSAPSTPASGQLTIYAGTDHKFHTLDSTGVDSVISAGGLAFYGDGSDGNVTISGTTTLTRDMYYDTLTVQSGGILKPDGFRIYCKTKCDVQTGGVIRNNGNDAAGSTAGGNLNLSSELGGGRDGGNGGAANANGGASNGAAYGGRGSAGGTGNGGATAAGSVGTMTTSASVRTTLAALVGWATTTTSQGIQSQHSGGGGSGGGGGSTGAGGGGGGGAGTVFIAARSLVVAGTIEAKGGVGGNATAANGGGGGGGGGGYMILVYTTKTATGTISVAGGAGGAKDGTGVAGTAGNTGTLVEFAN